MTGRPGRPKESSKIHQQRDRTIYDKCQAGAKYRVIAAEYGITPERIRRIYCDQLMMRGDYRKKPRWRAASERALARSRERLEKLANGVCRECGNRFTRTRLHGFYCSKKCKYRYCNNRSRQYRQQYYQRRYTTRRHRLTTTSIRNQTAN
jgi:hypothetical protein